MAGKPTKRVQEYWDTVLRGYGLGLGRGKGAKVDYVGDAKDIGVFETKIVSKKTGRVRPKGKGPE
jgi:hypothetical protein